MEVDNSLVPISASFVIPDAVEFLELKLNKISLVAYATGIAATVVFIKLFNKILCCNTLFCSGWGSKAVSFNTFLRSE